MKEKLIIISIIIASIIVGGLIYLNNSTEEDLYSDINESEWCVPNNNVTIFSKNMTNISGEMQFTIIGKTIYKGKKVCQAEYNYGDETLIQYSTMKNDSTIFVYKNNSDIINEFEFNSSKEDISDYYSKEE